ncbi:MOSC domain-containing protein [Patescibacteria group bacterium]|nr:MOSC domain-containing protein [Patescibacteria group bacterium]
MELVDWATVEVASGIVGDCRGVGGLTHKRQVTILSQTQWEEAYSELGTRLRWTERRANLYVAGIVFGPQYVDKTLVLGEGVQLKVTGETEPCKRMDEAHMGLKQALTPNWRAGVTCRVIVGGVIRKGDTITVY